MHQDLAFKPPGSVLAGEKLENPSKLRAKLCLILLLAGFVAVAVKLVTIQILEHDFWVNYAGDQRKSAITIQPRRGTIYDRNGIPLATSLSQEILCLVPSRITNPAKLAKSLSSLIGIPAKSILEKVRETKLYLVYIQRGLNSKLAGAIRAMGLSGIEFRSESSRRYPKGSLAAHVIGFSNVDNKGLEGIEYLLDLLLRGEAGKEIVVKDNSRREIAALAQQIKDVRDGNHVTLTIDAYIQYSAEKALDEIVRKYSPESATAVIIDPKTGQLLAMAGRPTFDPNKPSTFQAERLRNRAVTDVFEPGSAFKPIIAAAALERGVITPEDRVFCEYGAMRYYRHTFNDVHPLGEVTFAVVMAESSNIGMIKVAGMLPAEVIYEYIRSFGFGSATGIDLPGDSGGIVHPPSRWSGLSLGSMAIGQEIGVTALQLVVAFSTIANGGKMMKPYVISEIRDPSGEALRQNRPRFVRQVISPETAATLTELLVGVVDFGTGTNAQIKGYRVAGKTGTAQKADLVAGGYHRDKYVAVFAGFVPADNPAACILVTVDSPRGKHYGGEVAAPAFRRIAKDILNYMEIAPTEREQPTAPDPGPRVAPAPHRKSDGADLIIADVDGKFAMPDVRGKTMRAIAGSPLARLVRLEFEGSGVACRQTPAPTTKIEKGQRCQIVFKRTDPR